MVGEGYAGCGLVDLGHQFGENTGRLGIGQKKQLIMQTCYQGFKQVTQKVCNLTLLVLHMLAASSLVSDENSRVVENSTAECTRTEVQKESLDPDIIININQLKYPHHACQTAPNIPSCLLIIIIVSNLAPF